MVHIFITKIIGLIEWINKEVLQGYLNYVLFTSEYKSHDKSVTKKSSLFYYNEKS